MMLTIKRICNYKITTTQNVTDNSIRFELGNHTCSYICSVSFVSVEGGTLCSSYGSQDCISMLSSNTLKWNKQSNMKYCCMLMNQWIPFCIVIISRLKFHWFILWIGQTVQFLFKIPVMLTYSNSKSELLSHTSSCISFPLTGLLVTLSVL